MTLQQRIDLLARLGEYIKMNNTNWQKAKEKAGRENPWFIPEFIDRAIENISDNFLKEKDLLKQAKAYHIPEENPSPKKVGIVMAGNITLVGFHKADHETQLKEYFLPSQFLFFWVRDFLWVHDKLIPV